MGDASPAPQDPTTPVPGDHRRKPRRRGETLQRAIFEATLDELSDLGYVELTMERVAERARTSKASLYRRWNSKAALVVDAVGSSSPRHGWLPDTGEVRRDILALLRVVADWFAGPAGEAARGLLAEIFHDPERMHTIRVRIAGSGIEPMLEILRRGAARGEVTPTALTSRIASVGPVLLRDHFLLHGAPIADDVLTGIVDEVVLPLVRTDSESANRGDDGQQSHD